MKPLQKLQTNRVNGFQRPTFAFALLFLRDQSARVGSSEVYDSGANQVMLCGADGRSV